MRAVRFHGGCEAGQLQFHYREAGVEAAVQKMCHGGIVEEVLMFGGGGAEAGQPQDGLPFESGQQNGTSHQNLFLS